MARLTIQRQAQTNRRFFEDLGNDVRLEMVLVPGGSFQMGAPDHELDCSRSESPQRQVTLQTFFMGRYQVTQEQWRQIAGFDAVRRDLDADPSRFRGDSRPVEQVTWYGAVEFCDRLSKRSGRLYRLPSEAEWEYACRAGTQTPFHFGKTITDELANYDATETYGRGPKGEYRRETTPVNHFNAPNAFGLSDMHGNVWEWCLDPWHDTYEGASTDGRAWTEGRDDVWRVLRGGSWYTPPSPCRSAHRHYQLPDHRYAGIGFRVVCAVRGTP